jgi:hypothetical protein
MRCQAFQPTRNLLCRDFLSRLTPQILAQETVTTHSVSVEVDEVILEARNQDKGYERNAKSIYCRKKGKRRER